MVRIGPPSSVQPRDEAGAMLEHAQMEWSRMSVVSNTWQVHNLRLLRDSGAFRVVIGVWGVLKIHRHCVRGA